MADTIKTQRMFRSVKIDRAAVDIEARTCALSFSSEAPVGRWFGQEVLSHAPGAMRTGRLLNGAPLLLEHEPEDLIGVVEEVGIADGMGRAVVRFSRSEDGEAAFQDVIDGIRQNVSVGYVIHKMVEETAQDNSGNKQTVCRVTDWEPLEISLVAIPADPNVGVGRALDGEEVETVVTRAADVEPQQVETTKPEQELIIMADVQVTDNGAEERARVTAITKVADLYQQYGARELAMEFIRDGKDVNAFQNAIMEKMASRHSDARGGAADLDLTHKEAKQYSLMRALHAMAEKNWEGAGFELDCHREIEKRMGRSGRSNSIFVPLDVQKRDLTAGTPSAGGYNVATENKAGDFIEALRNRSVALNMGATRMSGLQGNVTIPKQTAAATAYWLSTEATAATESQLTLGQLALSPKNVGAYTEISRQLMLQSNPAADGLVMNDLAAVTALAVDAAVISGSGSAGQPQGIIGSAGVGSVTGTSIDYAKILEFQTDVMGGNALLNPASFGYVTTPAVAALLAQRARFSNTDTPLWEGNLFDGNVVGFKAMSSLQVPTANVLAGDWSQVILAEWGVLELEVNPYANFAAGIVGVRAFYTVDVGVRWGASFSLATSVT